MRPRNHGIVFALTLTAASCAARQEHAMSDTTTSTTSTTTSTGATTSDARTTAVRSGHVAVNGVHYYYEVHGTGAPLLLLHGGLGTLEMFDPMLPQLTRSHQVITVDLHGHGRTRLGDRPFSPIDQGDDMAVLLDRLGYGAVDVAGYSLGGGVAFRLAVQHPDKVRRLVLVSVNHSTDGFYPEMRPMQHAISGAMAEAMKPTPMYKAYVAVAPDPSEFPKLLDRVGDWMRKDYDWGEDVAKLKMPVILIVGDSDMFRLEHVIDFYTRLGGGQRDAGWTREHIAQNRLAILPNVTHYEMFLSPLLPPTILDFLDGTGRASQWSDQVAK